MTEKRDTSADQLTFSQHYGHESLPQPIHQVCFHLTIDHQAITT